MLSLHAMLAGVTHTPELVIDAKEAATISDAAVKVAELYDLTADPKTIAWSNLVMCLGMVYGTRMVAINMRHKTERRKRTQSNVSPIRSGVSGDFGTPDGKLPPFEPPTTKQ